MHLTVTGKTEKHEDGPRPAAPLHAKPRKAFLNVAVALSGDVEVRTNTYEQSAPRVFVVSQVVGTSKEILGSYALGRDQFGRSTSKHYVSVIIISCSFIKCRRTIFIKKNIINKKIDTLAAITITVSFILILLS